MVAPLFLAEEIIPPEWVGLNSVLIGPCPREIMTHFFPTASVFSAVDASVCGYVDESYKSQFGHFIDDKDKGVPLTPSVIRSAAFLPPSESQEASVNTDSIFARFRASNSFTGKARAEWYKNHRELIDVILKNRQICFNTVDMKGHPMMDRLFHKLPGRVETQNKRVMPPP